MESVGKLVITCTLITVGLVAAVVAGDEPFSDFPNLTGPYFGQTPPGVDPEPFADDLLKPPGGFHSAVVFSSDGAEAWWTGMGKDSYVSYLQEGRWTRPARVPFDTVYGIGEPMFFPEDERLFFLCTRPLDSDPVVRERIWYVEREDGGWSIPAPVDEVVYRHPTHWQFSFPKSGSLYFTSEIEGVGGKQDIFVSQWDGENFQPPVSLGDSVNSDLRDFCPFVAPDESYLLFSRSVPEEHNRSDLFVSFRGSSGTWSRAINLGDEVNSLHNETCPVVTPDGRFLFFLRVSGETNGLWWVSSAVIDRLRPQ